MKEIIDPTLIVFRLNTGEPEAKEATMTWIELREVTTKTMIFSGSGIFLAWYLLAKISSWPWGAFCY